jgi:hypothetical protein
MNQPLTLMIGMTIDHINKAWTLYNLRYNRGNKTLTANMLGISVRTLDAWLEKYQNEEKIEEERKRIDEAKRAEYLDRARGITRDVPAPTGFISGGSSVHATSARAHMESAPQIPQKQSVPVPERAQIQNVLPEQSQGRGKHKRG